MLSRPFLTDLDSRAEVRGSVDPLGAMAIWSRLGRRVVGNLSTVTNSVRDFKTLVLGFGLLRELHRAAEPDDEINDLAAFLRWEQLAAYTRYGAGDQGFRGLRRVKARLGQSRIVPISAEGDCQILGNQKVYGLWGLFTVPSRASGLLEKDVNDLTQAGAEFVERMWKPTLSPIWNKLVTWVSRDDRKFNLERHAGDIKRLRAVWRGHSAAERPFWERHLIDGGPTDRTEGKQSRLPEQLGLIEEEGDRGLTLTVEEEVLLGDPNLHVARLGWLIARVCRAADRVEQHLWGELDATFSEFGAMLAREGRLLTDGD